METTTVKTKNEGYIYLVNFEVDGKPGLFVPICTFSNNRQQLISMMKDSWHNILEECGKNPAVTDVKVESDIPCGYVYISYNKEGKSYYHTLIVSTCEVV